MVEPDIFRKNYHPQTEEQTDVVSFIKDTAKLLYECFDKASKYDPRLLAIAKTHLEIAVAMAVKGVTTPQPLPSEKK